MYRYAQSTLTVPLSASGLDIKSPITIVDLEDAVPTGGGVKPVAIDFEATTGLLSDVTARKLHFRSEKGTKASPHITIGDWTLDKFNDKVKSKGDGDVFERIAFLVQHGLQLVGNYDNATGTEIVIKVYWKLANMVPALGNPALDGPGGNALFNEATVGASEALQMGPSGARARSFVPGTLANP